MNVLEKDLPNRMKVADQAANPDNHSKLRMTRERQLKNAKLAKLQKRMREDTKLLKKRKSKKNYKIYKLMVLVPGSFELNLRWDALLLREFCVENELKNSISTTGYKNGKIQLEEMVSAETSLNFQEQS